MAPLPLLDFLGIGAVWCNTHASISHLSKCVTARPAEVIVVDFWRCWSQFQSTRKLSSFWTSHVADVSATAGTFFGTETRRLVLTPLLHHGRGDVSLLLLVLISTVRDFAFSKPLPTQTQTKDGTRNSLGYVRRTVTGGPVQALGEVVTSPNSNEGWQRNNLGYVRRTITGGPVQALGEVVTSPNSNEGWHEEQRRQCATLCRQRTCSGTL